MNPIYNLAIQSYRLAVKLATVKVKKARLMLDGQKQTFDIIARSFGADERPIWIHASSLGEFEQGRPLIEMIRRNHPGTKIILSFFSPSGYEVRKNYTEVDAVCYLPFDTPSNAKRFVKMVNPRIAIFIKYEFWGNYLQQLKRKGIPTFIISAIFRETQSFFKPWGGMFRGMLKCYTKLYLQDNHSKRLLESIGITNTEVLGDTRFDRVTDILASTSDFPQIEKFAKSGSTTLIMGSSWQPDEDVVLPYFEAHDDMRLIIAPHEIHESRIEGLMAKLKRKAVRYSQLKPGETINADILIIDCFGILASCYRYGDIAYIGGGFGVGIHNINEAAVYGMPVIFGPNYKKFKEAHDLIALGGAFSINSSNQFSSLMDKLTDKAYLQKTGNIAGEYIKSNLGATKAIYQELAKYL